MKKSYKHYYFLFALSVFIFSCNKESMGEHKLTLDVSKTEIYFSSIESKDVIQVKTNAKDYKVEVSQDWIKCEKLKEAVVISASENIYTKQREGEVSVIVNSIKKIIKVTQRAADVYMELQPEKILVDAIGGDFSFDIKTNLQKDKYELLSSVEWIQIKTNDDGKVFFSVSRYEGLDLRKGYITVNIEGKEIGKVEVEQKGKNIYFLPSFKFGEAAAVIKEFEEERGSKKNRETDISGTGTLISYEINDQIFDELIYLMNLKGYVQSSLFVKGGSIDEDHRNKFEQFLIEVGFEKRTEKGFFTTLSPTKEDKVVFVNLSEQVKIEFMADANRNHYRIVYYANQTNDYKTFSSLPFFELGKTKSEVEEYEKSHQGIFSADKSSINYGKEGGKKDKLFFNVEGDQIFGRTYWVYYPNQEKQGLRQITNYYADVNLAFFQGLDGDYYLTKEFLSLAEKEGFVYKGKTKKGSSFFENEEKKINMYLIWAKDKDFGWSLKVTIFSK